MPGTLYVTYDESELLAHGARFCAHAIEQGWKTTDAPKDVEKTKRESVIAKHDALLLLLAWKYRYSVVEEWETARKLGKPVRALFVDEGSPWWPQAVIEGVTATKERDSLKEKIGRYAAESAFGLELTSLGKPAGEALRALEQDLQEKQIRKAFVVWDSKIDGLELILSSLKKRPPKNFTLQVQGLSEHGVAGEILTDAVLRAIENSDRVLVVTDQPNVNVAFETGMALGLGKLVSLMHFSSTVPAWLAPSALRGHAVNAVHDIDQIREKLEDEDSWFKPSAPVQLPSYGATLFLCPSGYIGSALREEQTDFDSSWISTPSVFSLHDLNERFSQVSQVVWSIAAYPEGSDTRDGAENAANALIAGWFFGRAHEKFRGEDRKSPWDEIEKRLTILKHSQFSRVLADIVPYVKPFTSLKEFRELLSTVPDGLPAAVFRDKLSIGKPKYEMTKIDSLFVAQVQETWAGIAPVTNREYGVFCEERSWPMPDQFAAQGLDMDAPVVQVSALDAQEFCKWLSESVKQDIDLPDAALWWHFARAGEKGIKYWWGNDDTLVHKVAWHAGNSGDKPHAVKGKKVNTWGLYDIFGNVREWTKPTREAVIRPNSLGESIMILRARVLGGAYDTTASALTHEVTLDATDKRTNVGFRCVLLR